MPSDSQTAPVSKKMLWIGCIISALPVLVLVASATAKFVKPGDNVDQRTVHDGAAKSEDVLDPNEEHSFANGMAHLGWPLELANVLGGVELTCTILYVIPQTAVLGAILITGYLGGAIATHLRIGEYHNMLLPFGLGILVWLGLCLRDGRLWALIPLRRK